ncbi:hypothetical protein AMR72_15315 [Flavobacterium psychrophilum]|nr:hypothetical protein AMR72_15315 [Flavobacterium psychrophilum]AOE53761.1 hypothetical protein ALW18_15305 [Flavobacterium psychrophilum]
MKIIDRTDIESWAKRYEAKSDFPYLISRLVRATGLPSLQVNILSGSAAYLGGWDGIVFSEDDRSYYPKGISLWEFGTESNVKKKAEEDYKKRTADPLGYNKSECTYIFITPYLYTKKGAWVKEKKAEGVWKDVRFYDAVDLVQWLDHCTPVEIWFATLTGKLPYDGIYGADQFWEEWSVGPQYTFTPESITSGRERAMEALKEFLSGAPGIKAFRASTKNEAIAFVVASAKQFLPEEQNRFFAKTLLVEHESSYRPLHKNTKVALNIIPKFENKQSVYAAVSSGHHVIVPLGGDDEFSKDFTVGLPILGKEGLVNSLVAMGFSREDAERYSREAARDITILRRMLHFQHNAPIWSKSAQVPELLPALIVGRWNDKSEADQELLVKLAGKPYDQFVAEMAQWLRKQEAPLLFIGDMWRLTSPLDLWSTIASHLKSSDLQYLSDALQLVYGDFTEEAPGDESKYFTKPTKYSKWIKEGLTQSIVLIAVYGYGLNIPGVSNPQLWVNGIVSSLIGAATGPQWKSFDQQLPLLSEASPEVFIEAVYSSLEHPDKPIMEMFNTSQGLLGDTPHHTGLLWALEGLAWLPEYLYDITILLLKLSDLDPGGNLVNRPDNSLVEIYLPWHHQTLAPYKERMEILEAAVMREPEQGWHLLLRLLPKNFGYASPTHKMRWRLFSQDTNLTYTYEETYETYSHVIRLLLKLYDKSEVRMAQLVEQSDELANIADLEVVLSFIEDALPEMPPSEVIREKLRSILSRHRAHPDAQWALPQEFLVRYQKLYDLMIPDDLLQKNKWLFEGHYIEFPDGDPDWDSTDEKHLAHSNRIKSERLSALQDIYQSNGVSGVIELASIAGFPTGVGETLSEIELSDPEIIEVTKVLFSNDAPLEFLHSFIRGMVQRHGLDWAIKLYDTFSSKDYAQEGLVNVFTHLNHNTPLWDFVDKQDEKFRELFWSKTWVNFYHVTPEEKLRGIKYLLKYKRFYSAVEETYMGKEKINPEFIYEVLDTTAKNKSAEERPLREYVISTLFERLDKSDLPDEKKASLELHYLSIIGNSPSRYKPKYLNKELAENPKSFVEVLKWVYMPKSEDRRKEEFENISREAREGLARQGYRLLDNFKDIPGMDADGTVDAVVLNSWVAEVRELAALEDRLEIADMQIGKLLAQYPEKNKEYWPADAISDVLELVNTESIKNNFSIAITNKRGFTSRAAFEGGAIERRNAAYFQTLSDAQRLKHPMVSKILGQIAQRYLNDAQREDDEAKRDSLEY